MSTAVGTDVEIIQALDFEVSKACESRQVACAKDAAFLVVHICCGATLQLCTPHTDEARAWFAQHQLWGLSIDCVRCGKTKVPFPAILPMGGAS